MITIETPEQGVKRHHFDVFIFYYVFAVFIVNFEQINATWAQVKHMYYSLSDF